MEGTIETIRRFDCKHYDRCLDYHAFRDWLEIDCHQCSQYERDNLWRNDNPFAIALFLLELFKKDGGIEE